MATEEQSQVVISTRILRSARQNLVKERQAYLIKKEKKKQVARENGARLANLMRERRAAGVVAKKRNKSKKAGVIFPVNKFLSKIKKEMPKFRIYVDSAVLLTGAIEYLVAEILDLSGRVAEKFSRKRITPRHLFLAINADEELHRVLSKVTIAGGGVTPSIDGFLLRNKKKSLKAMIN